MKFYLTKDEWYPVYGLSSENRPYLHQYTVDVTPELFEEVQRMEEAFDELQEILCRLPTKYIPASVK